MQRSELWAWGASCDLWFFCFGASDDVAARPACPVCRARTEVTERRIDVSQAAQSSPRDVEAPPSRS